MHKFLCCSDTHLLKPPALDEEGATAWLHAGDVYNRGHAGKGSKGLLAQQLDEWMSARKIPVFVVKGNHDCSFDKPFFDKAEHVSGSFSKAAPGVWIMGIGWCGGVFYDLPTERDMQTVCEQAKRQFILKFAQSEYNIGDKIILLTHYPPWNSSFYSYNSNPEGWMSEAVMELVDHVKPTAVVQGHVHDIFGKQLVYKGAGFETLIVSPGPCGGVLTLEDDGKVNFKYAGIDPKFFEGVDEGSEEPVEEKPEEEEEQ